RPPMPDAIADYGWALVNAGRPNDAEPIFRGALAADRSHVRAALGLGRLRLGREDLDGAADAFNRVPESKQFTDEQAAEIAEAWFSTGQPSRGLAFLRKAVAARPDDAYLASMLAWLLATHPSAEIRNGPEALRLARAASAMPGPMQARALQALAAALAET